MIPNETAVAIWSEYFQQGDIKEILELSEKKNISANYKNIKKAFNGEDVDVEIYSLINEFYVIRLTKIKYDENILIKTSEELKQKK